MIFFSLIVRDQWAFRTLIFIIQLPIVFCSIWILFYISKCIVVQVNNILLTALIISNITTTMSFYLVCRWVALSLMYILNINLMYVHTKLLMKSSICAFKTINTFWTISLSFQSIFWFFFCLNLSLQGCSFVWLYLSLFVPCFILQDQLVRRGLLFLFITFYII